MKKQTIRRHVVRPFISCEGLEPNLSLSLHFFSENVLKKTTKKKPSRISEHFLASQKWNVMATASGRWGARETLNKRSAW